MILEGCGFKGIVSQQMPFNAFDTNTHHVRSAIRARLPKNVAQDHAAESDMSFTVQLIAEEFVFVDAGVSSAIGLSTKQIMKVFRCNGKFR